MAGMRFLSLDLETFSDVDLSKCGLYRYVEGDFHILLFAYAFDDEEPRIVDMACGEQIPQEVLDAIDDPEIIKAAWNAQFERTCIGHYLGRVLSPDSWRCSMVHAASLSLPLALKNAAKVLKTGEQKDKAGENLIKYFSVPCKPTKANGGRTRNLPEHDPEKWRQFKGYCLQDVRTERDIRKRLEMFPMPDREWDFYHMDQRINDRGVRIDTELVEKAISCDLMLSEEMSKRAYRLTGLENPNSVSQLKGWLEGRGIPVETLGKKDVAAMIADLDKNSCDQEALDMLKLRLQMAKSSVKKYQAAERCVCSDGRAHGLFQFYGASRTGRFCLTGDHEVLTTDGWISLADWKGEKIACWNASSEIVSFQKAEKVEFNYNGPMYEYHDARICQLSTPDHKMRVKKRYDGEWQDDTVENMARYRPCIPFTGRRISMPGMEHNQLRILVMTQADGSYTAEGSLNFHFSKLRKIARCKHLLRQEGIAFIVGISEKDGAMTIKIPSRVQPLWLRMFRDKKFGSWLLEENADVFFDELSYWDGYRPAPNSIQFSTCCKENADLIQALAHLSGRSANMRIRRHSEKNPAWQDAYILDIWMAPKNCHEIRKKPEMVDFNGKVYCAVTQTGYFLVRRGGKVWVTGNSGRHIQLQNLPQNHISTLDEARELVKMGELGMLESIYGNVPDILSQLIRTMLVPKEGCEFIVADFSAIEARVLAWLAGEQWRLDALKNGEDIYCASASQMFGVPVVKHGINGELRQKGKVAELACIAEGSLVLTDKGLIPIEEVTTDHLLWDGEEWVSHEGLIFKGEREVIEYEGLRATEDHPVWIKGQARPVYFGVAAASGAHLVQTGDGRRAIRLGKNHISGKAVEQGVESMLCTDPMYGVRGNSVAESGESYKRIIKRLPELFPAETDSKMAGPQADCCKTTLRKSKRRRLSQLRRQRNPIQLSECHKCGTVSDRKIRFAGQGNGDRPDRHEWGLCTGESEVCGTQHQLRQSAEECPFTVRTGILALRIYNGYQEVIRRLKQGRGNLGCGGRCSEQTEELAAHRGKVRVYDIQNAGRHHRFTVSGKLVHNCGYQGGNGALISMGALDMGLKESELPSIIEQWRSASPHIVQFWWDMEKAAVDTVRDHQEHIVGKVQFQFYSGTLWMVLPGGRKLAYLKPRLEPNRFGRMSLTFEGGGTSGGSGSGNWSRQETYGGKLTENCTQATARDILTEAMRRLEKAGLQIVGHVHDEVIIEAPVGKYTVDEVCSLMAQNPEWCPDCPLAAAGYLAPNYYFKD